MSGGEPVDETLESGAAPAPSLFADRYRILRPLGRGAFKEVYLAHDERLDREVALALLKGGAQAERVRREMQVTGRLGEHPHVVTVHDAGEHDGVTYLVLRAVGGGSLAARLAQAPGGRLALGEVARLGGEVADALAHAHAHGVVHRDVKPDNIWLDAAGHAVLGDFGVALGGGAARITADRAVVGTLAYLSPEQARGEAAGPASDLYGLGATLYELACGRPPFTGETAESLIGQHLGAVPLPPSALEPAAAPLDDLLLRLLAKDPRDRAPSAAAVRDELTGGAPATPATGLVGRERPMAALTSAFDEALAGQVRIVALEGEPGIGKTRCAEELARHAERRGAVVAWGSCSEDQGAPAYWPWRRALQRAGVALPALEGAPGGVGDSPDEARFRLFEAVADALTAAAVPRPLVLLLEDLHWADQSSLALLVHVARSVRSARLLVVCTARRDAPALADALERLTGAPSFSSVALVGLDRAEIARYAQQVAGEPVPVDVADALSGRTLGNPLYVAELVRSLTQDGRLGEVPANAVPRGLRSIVGRRVAALPAPTRELLTAAAVAGGEFPLATVAQAAGMPPAQAAAAAQPALRERILAAASGRHRFCHAVIRDVVYEALDPAERAARHAAVLEALEARGEHPAAELAHHAVIAARGGLDPAPALRWSREAAEEALRLHAYAEGAAHLERALEAAELGDVIDGEDRLALGLEAAAARAAAGDHDLAREGFARAAARAARLGESGALARAALGFAEFQHYGVVDEPAIALLERALDRLPPEDSALRAQVLGRLAVRLDPARDRSRREQLLDEAVAMARRLGGTAPLARLLALSPLIRWGGPESDARRLADAREAVTLADACGDREAALWGLIVLHSERFGAGDIAGADAELAAYERHAAALRQPYYRWYGTLMRAARAIFDGRVDEGARLADVAVAVNREHEDDADQEWVVQRLLLARLRGDPAGVPLEALGAFAARYDGMPLWTALLAVGEWVAGDLGAARARLDRCTAAGLEAMPPGPDGLCTVALLGDVCAAVGAVQPAPLLARLLAPHAERNVLTHRSWAAWGAAARPRGRLLALTGDREGAARELTRAVELHRAWGSRPWLAYALLDRAEAIGDGAARDEGLAIAADLGFAPLRQRPSSANDAQ